MRVESQAGKFILSFDRMDPGETEIVITGKMGVWEAKTYMTRGELLNVLRMTMPPRMLRFLAGVLLRAGRARRESKD